MRWLDAFNCADLDALAGLFHSDAVNHQVANEPVTDVSDRPAKPWFSAAVAVIPPLREW